MPDLNIETAADASQPSNAAERQSLFLVLEGGGAKGIAHIAAWEILEPMVEMKTKARSATAEAPRFKLSGVAGTSAGAVVAAFIAAGATSGQLVDGSGHIPLCCELGIERFYDLFGLTGWRRLKQIRWCLSANFGLARRLTPRWQQPLHDEDEVPSPSALARGTSIARHGGFWLIVFIAFWVALDIFVVKQPFLAAISFIVVWIASNIFFGISHQKLKSLEARRKLENRRHLERYYQRIYHPLTPIAAGILTGTLLEAGIWWCWPDQSVAFITNYATRGIVAPLTYALGAALIIISIAVLVRRIVKGTVNTVALADDLNTALVSVLTKTPAWNAEAKRYDWIPKTPQSAVEIELFERFAREPERHISFDELMRLTEVPLSVVAADTVKNEVYVFSSDTHKNYSVARAVTSSLAIPIAFRPVYYGARILVDGGVVSSIPAWVYRRHRTRDPDARILAIGIAPAETDSWIPYFLAARRKNDNRLRRKGIGWLYRISTMTLEARASFIWPFRVGANVASTAAFGARELELDASDRLDSFLLHPKFGLLDFDKSGDEAKIELKRLKDEARFKIQDALWQRKEAFSKLCSRFEEDLRTYLAERPSQANGRIRMFWAERDGRADSVRIKFTYGFTESDLDDRLVLPFRSSMSGWAAFTRKSHFAEKAVLDLMIAGPMNRYRRAVKWKSLKWCWAIPVLDAGTKRLSGVLAIESDMEMSVFDRVLGEEARARSSSWFGPDGQALRTSPTDVPTPKMAQLEVIWADVMWNDFASLKREPIPAGHVRPHQDRWTKLLGPTLFGALQKMAALRRWYRSVRFFK